MSTTTNTYNCVICGISKENLHMYPPKNWTMINNKVYFCPRCWEGIRKLAIDGRME